MIEHRELQNVLCQLVYFRCRPHDCRVPPKEMERERSVQLVVELLENIDLISQHFVDSVCAIREVHKLGQLWWVDLLKLAGNKQSCHSYQLQFSLGNSGFHLYKQV